MSTKNPRINLTLEESTVNVLAKLAMQEHKSIAGVARELVLEALERREDRALSAIAKTRDTTKIKRIKHEDAWK